MLICKNCNSENVDGTVKCVQCNMEGKFIHISENGKPSDYLVIEKGLHQCTNCGSEAPGKEDKCVHCHFPLPKGRTKPNPITNKQDTRNYSAFQPWEISNQKTG